MNRSEILDAYRQIRVADLSDALRTFNVVHRLVVDPQIQPITPGYDMRGYAHTLRYVPTQEAYTEIHEEDRARAIAGDPTAWQENGKGAGIDPDGYQSRKMRLRAALEQAEEETVMCIDVGGEYFYKWGSAINLQAIAMGLCGIVVDGGVRDVFDLVEQELPIFGRYKSGANGSPQIELESVGSPVVIGNVQVKQGDLIAGDDDGLLVVPSELIEPVLAVAQSVNEMDEAKVAEWQEKVVERYGEGWRAELRQKHHRAPRFTD